MSADFTDFKEQVRNSADIVEVVSGYVALKKRGRNYWGCCPFHGEKTPSFSVNAEKNMFYCFGCHEGGDVFRFIMKSENCSFIEAVKMLAARYGIPIPEKEKTAEEIKRDRQRKELGEANELAVRFYQSCLLRTQYGKTALAYLAGRGITQQIIEQFSIGYAIDNFSALTTSLGKRGCSTNVLIKAGLALPGKNGGAYDKFRGRVMIPIKDARGRVVGFGGRVLGSNMQPKYMNTGETELFNKRYLLFGMDIAVKNIKALHQAIVVEGYMDAISLHAAGITNAVASMGTAFSAEQARILKRITDNVVFCYDSDDAGRRASVRAVSIAREAGLQVQVAGVPNGKDPDEFVRQYGKDAFLEVVKQAPDGIDFQIEETIRQNNVTNLAGKVEAVSNILPFLLECKSEIEAAGHIRKLAQRLTIDEGLIADEYRKAARRKNPSAAMNIARAAAPEMVPADNQAETVLLAVLLEHPDMAADCQDTIEEVGFVHKGYGEIFKALLFVQDEENPVEKLTSLLDDEQVSMVAGLLSRHIVDSDCEKIVEDCLRQMKETFLKQQYEKHRLLADEFERSGDKRFIDELMESQRIQHEIKKLYGS